eukprot:6438798-Pyramimonas_sp.AAC.1
MAKTQKLKLLSRIAADASLDEKKEEAEAEEEAEEEEGRREQQRLGIDEEACRESARQEVSDSWRFLGPLSYFRRLPPVKIDQLLSPSK